MKNLNELKNNEEFLNLELKEQKQLVLDAMKKDLITRMFNNGMIVKQESSLKDLLYQFNEYGEDNNYLKRLNKVFIEIIESMQLKNVEIVNSSFKIQNQIYPSFITYRLTTTPIFSYTYNGELKSIELSSRVKDFNLIISLLNFYEDRFLENKYINRLIRRNK